MSSFMMHLAGLGVVAVLVALVIHEVRDDWRT